MLETIPKYDTYQKWLLTLLAQSLSGENGMF